MKCPACNAKVVRESVEGGMVMYCDRCGWGKDRAHAAREQGLEPEEGPGKPPLILIVLGLVFSVGLIVGPYVALTQNFPDLPGWIHLTYWLTMVTYLFFAATVTPSYDTSNMGLFGTTIDNPFSWEDDMNRAGMTMAVLLLPGKAVAWSVRGAYRWVRG